VKESETAGEESSLLPLAVDDVEGIEQRLHRGVGAPKGNPKSDDEGRAESPASFRRNPRELVPDDVDGATWKNSRELIEMPGDGGRIGEQAVDRDQGRERGKDRQQAVVGHSCREGQYAVLGNVRIDAQQNVLPSARRDLGGRARQPATALLVGGLRDGLAGRHLTGAAAEGTIGGFAAAAFFGRQHSRQGCRHQENDP